MPLELLEKVKEFLTRLIKDRAFLTQLENSNINERNEFLQNTGYNFSKEEFETATIQLLDLKEKGEFTELSEEELVAAVGGFIGGKYPIVQPLYGVIRSPLPSEPIDSWPLPIEPINPPIQPMYGVIRPVENPL